MSDRERWTVYPLLFLALALSLRDKIFPNPQQSVVARDVTIVDAAGRPSILLRGADKDGVPALEFVDPKGGPAPLLRALGGSIVARDLMVIDPQARPRVVLGTTPEPASAGRIEFFDAKRTMLLTAGENPGQFGELTTFRAGKVPQVAVLSDADGAGRCLVFDAQGQAMILVGPTVRIQHTDPSAGAGEVQTPQANDAPRGQAPPTGSQTPATDQPPTQPGAAKSK